MTMHNCWLKYVMPDGMKGRQMSKQMRQQLTPEAGKKYLTREGAVVEVLRTGLPDDHSGDSVVGVIFKPGEPELWDTGSWDAQGRWDQYKGPMDLVEVYLED